MNWTARNIPPESDWGIHLAQKMLTQKIKASKLQKMKRKKKMVQLNSGIN